MIASFATLATTAKAGAAIAGSAAIMRLGLVVLMLAIALTGAGLTLASRNLLVALLGSALLGMGLGGAMLGLGFIALGLIVAALFGALVPLLGVAVVGLSTPIAPARRASRVLVGALGALGFASLAAGAAYAYWGLPDWAFVSGATGPKAGAISPFDGGAPAHAAAFTALLAALMLAAGAIVVHRLLGGDKQSFEPSRAEQAKPPPAEPAS